MVPLDLEQELEEPEALGRCGAFGNTSGRLRLACCCCLSFLNRCPSALGIFVVAMVIEFLRLVVKPT
ncbi:hypothetical protein BDV10DRAFT_155734 [Aspergillus recurvatus]